MSQLTKDLVEGVKELCGEVAGSYPVTAACAYGSRVSGYARRDSDVDVLLILEEYERGLHFQYEKIRGVDACLLVVDRHLFERDVSEASVGEFVASRIITPYRALINYAYLRSQEVKLKKRLVTETLKNLVHEYSYLATELRIKPEYFLLEDVDRRVRIYPHLKYSFFKMLSPKLSGKNLKSVMRGYLTALVDLEKEGILHFDGDEIRVDEAFVSSTLKSARDMVTIVESIGYASRPFILHGVALTIDPLTITKRITEYLSRQLMTITEQLEPPEDPSSYLKLKTDLGEISLGDELTIHEFGKKLATRFNASAFEIKPLSGILNSVYLLRFTDDPQERKVVAKVFLDWNGLKWFPLALWTLGVQDFAIYAKDRLVNEYTMNRFLENVGFRVPRIYHISWKKRLLFEEFVPGKTLDLTVKDFISGPETGEQERSIRGAGMILAQLHKADVTMGDFKPENLIVDPEGRLTPVDLEQARKHGDHTWDLAEFLYFCGLYAKPDTPPSKGRKLAECFLNGYLEGGGPAERAKKIADEKYKSIFAPFIPNRFMRAIASFCEQL